MVASHGVALPYHASANCQPGHFYPVNLIFPGFHADGTPANPLNPHPAPDGSDFVFVPPSNVKTIGDAQRTSLYALGHDLCVVVCEHASSDIGPGRSWQN
jgi:hypothetical protein